MELLHGRDMFPLQLHPLHYLSRVAHILLKKKYVFDQYFITLNQTPKIEMNLPIVSSSVQLIPLRSADISVCNGVIFLSPYSALTLAPFSTNSSMVLLCPVRQIRMW